MKIVAYLKLIPTPEQHNALLDTLTTANRACTWLARQAWETQTFGQCALQRLTSHACRYKFLLAAQMVKLCIAKAVDTYTLDEKRRHLFRRYAAQPYNARIFHLCSDSKVSLWSTAGRLTIAYQERKGQQELLAFCKGKALLMYINEAFYFAVMCQPTAP